MQVERHKEEPEMAYEEFLEMYQSKLTTADEAVKVIKSGNWVDYGFCSAPGAG